MRGTSAGAYQLSKLPWTPTLSYRYAQFSGGDTHAFDSLFTGLPDWGYWFQGELLGEFVLSNSNLKSHQVRLTVKPTDWLDGQPDLLQVPARRQDQTFGVTPVAREPQPRGRGRSDRRRRADQLVVDHGDPRRRASRTAASPGRRRLGDLAQRLSVHELQLLRGAASPQEPPMPHGNTPMPEALASGFPVLLVGARVDEDSAVGRSVAEIRAALEALGRPVVVTHSLDDAEAAVESHPALSCVVLGWGMAAAERRVARADAAHPRAHPAAGRGAAGADRREPRRHAPGAARDRRAGRGLHLGARGQRRLHRRPHRRGGAPLPRHRAAALLRRSSRTSPTRTRTRGTRRVTPAAPPS